MARIPKWLQVTVSMCGGWFGIMSGGISIPFAFWTIFLKGDEKRSFTILAILGLVAFALNIVRRSHQLETELQSQKVAHTIEIDKLKADFKKTEDDLKQQLDDRERIRQKEFDRIVAKNGLGVWRRVLGDRISNVRRMGYYDYNKKYQSVDYRRYDPDTVQVIESIAEFLSKNFSEAETQYFWSKEGIQITKIEDYNGEKWTIVLDNLRQHARQLDKIIEKQI